MWPGPILFPANVLTVSEAESLGMASNTAHVRTVRLYLVSRQTRICSATHTDFHRQGNQAL